MNTATMRTAAARLPVLLLLLLPARAAVAQQFGLPAGPDGGAPIAAPGEGGHPRIGRCLIGLVDDVELPAPEPGVLTYLGVKLGDYVRAEQEIAKIDDSEVRQQFEVAVLAYNAANKRANDDIEERYSAAAARVAFADLQELKDANASVVKAVTNTDIRRAELEFDRSKLGAEKARNEQILAGYDAQTKRAELKLAELARERRIVRAPFDGQVIEILRDQQEWVSPGDTIVRVIRRDTLQAEGRLYFDDYDPRQVDGCEVTVSVNVGPGDPIEATGRIVHIHPVAEYDGRPMFRVRAEIANRQEDGRWLIMPQMFADMTIHLDTGGVAAARR
ncbi:pyruvate dehydrogenase dihydrolipoyltransacetylase [Pseudobythopirellula maris]|uniref:Pyruvate dehydrogenase dihydrolipoyltransacetylase n=1 Tax=Pseudobythopirellula maris TaxID=2527991 RepID=A0A5C5ZUW4_9BACT|nr:HlyD family efflux transporter periplasmic adaptor subunit [Pseudobythopirellula maris]TWT90895.1 pyruvate dehydrogenase dihydrolipoyltransacetylase [Pseudobythopirellula maris]